MNIEVINNTGRRFLAIRDQVVPPTLNLENPSGVAIQPGTGHIFTASRYGIHRYVPGARVARLEITEFPTDEIGTTPKYEIGPLSVAFLDDERLVVGDGGRPKGEEVVRIYKVGPESPTSPQKEDEAVQTLGPIEAGDDSETGEGNFFGLAVTDEAIYVTSGGDPAKGWILRAELTDGEPGELKPFIATREAVEAPRPGPITVHPESGELVVGQMGELDAAGDSLLTFYDPESGELKKSLKTGLNDITGIAYSPETDKLYVTDFSWNDPAEGGLFRLDIDGDEVEATKVLALDKPAGAVFDEEGRLYITVFGTPEEGSDRSQGELIVIDAGL
jgi:DNA-binding beta-propeller fold protein YncE